MALVRVTRKVKEPLESFSSVETAEKKRLTFVMVNWVLEVEEGLEVVGYLWDYFALYRAVRQHSAVVEVVGEEQVQRYSVGDQVPALVEPVPRAEGFWTLCDLFCVYASCASSPSCRVRREVRLMGWEGEEVPMLFVVVVLFVRRRVGAELQ